MQLTPEHVNKVLSGLPASVVYALKEFGPRVFLAGGFIRAAVADEKPCDVDLFVRDSVTAYALADIISKAEGFKGIYHTSYNALTLRREVGVPVQIIYRWYYSHPRDALSDFDFTIARAVLWWEKTPSESGEGNWRSATDPHFLEDVEARLLRYCSPDREEAYAGSLFRVFKFYKRGYTIPLEQLAAVLARACRNIEKQDLDVGERQIAGVLFSTLKEAGQRLPAPPKRGAETPDDIGVGEGAQAAGFSAGS